MPNRTHAAVWPLGALSAVVLGLEVFESRLVAYSVQVMVVYAVLGIALLGFGAAGSLVAVRRDWLGPDRLPLALAWSSLGFSVSIVIAHALFVRLTPYMTQVGWVALLLSGVLALPFLAAGTVVTLVLSSTRRVDSAYAANLIGSGVGCFLPLTLLGPLDGARLLGLFAVLAFGCAVPYLLPIARSSARLRWASGAGFVIALTALLDAPRVFPIQPEPEPFGQLAWQYRYASEHGIVLTKRYDRWNPTGRIEIVELSHVAGSPEPYPVMFYAQDSSAGSSLFRWDGRTRAQAPASGADTMVARMCTETPYGQGYFAPRGRVLVIGLGGGPDVQCALYNDARSVDAVEINRDSIAAIRGPMNEWVGGIGTNPRVHLYERDGRSFVRAQSNAYDLIQLSGVDTKNLMASGALALSENHLYTLEAIRDYLRLLAPDGVLSILRFGEPEAIRLANTSVQALTDLGIAHPERHIGMLHTGVLIGIIVSKTPWTEAAARLVQARLNPAVFHGVSVFYYSQNGVPLDAPAVIDYLPYVTSQGLAGTFFAHVEGSRLQELAKILPFDIKPATDDRPFFFDLWRYDRAETWAMPHVKALRELLTSVLLLSVALVLLPLRRLRGARGQKGPATVLLFACLGFGFMLIEVWLFHRFSMFLGHQIYSLSVVLATLLVATGAGAAIGGRLGVAPGRRARLGVCLVLLLVGLGVLVLPAALDSTLQSALPLRIVIAVGFTAPLGLALGLPFAGALAHVQQRNADSVPWCVGINGFASVFGSVAVVPLSMALGYSGVLAVGAALYATAGLAALTMRAEQRDAVAT